MPTGIASETKLLIASVFELLIQIIVHSRMGKPDSSKVLRPKGGSNKRGIPVEVAVGVLVGAAVGVSVCVTEGVVVGVSVGVPVGVFVGVSVGVSVGVAEGVVVGVSIGVFVGVCVGVLVGVLVRVLVGVAVGASTSTVALAVLPVPPFVEETVTLLFFVPAVEPSTLTENVQLPPAASIAPERLTVEEPAKAVIVPPPQLPVRPLGLETIKPAGRLSVKAMPVRVVPVLGLSTVKLRVVVPFNGMLAAPKDLLSEGGATTITVFEPVLFSSLSSSATLLGSTMAVLARLPAAVGVTLKVTPNDAFTGSVTVPAATQFKAVPVIEQLIVPVGGVTPFVIVNAPCG